MHNVLNRVQNVFGFFTTVVGCVAALIALVSLVATPTPPPGALELRNVQVVKGRPHYYSNKKEEYAHIRFDLDIDLSSLFTWNTKQLFLFITTTYPSQSSTAGVPATQAVIWDAILPHPLAYAHPNHYAFPSAATKPSKKNKKAKPPKNPGDTSLAPGLIRLANQRPKYQVTDVSGRLAARTNATLQLAWSAQPFVGALTWGVAAPRGELAPWWLPGPLRGLLATWRRAEGGVSTAAFDFPAVKNRTEAAKSVGPEGLDTARGGEANRGRPA